MNIPRLRSFPSTGTRKPIPASTYIDDSGDTVALPAYSLPSRPCGGCQQATAEGQEISKYRGSWWHSDCARRDVESGSPTEAWLALGHDLARSPGSYRVKETRAIVGALLGMIHAQDEEDETEAAGAS